MDNIKELTDAWLVAKQQEVSAQAKRRALEDELAKALGYVPTEGTTNFTGSYGKVRVVSRVETKVDSRQVDMIAKQNCLESYVGQLFRYKIEVNKGLWEIAPPEVTQAFQDAITSKFSRPSITVVENKE